MADNPNIDDLRAPLLAALGAADLALATVNELIADLRDRAGETRTDTRSRVEESRARLTKLQEDLPEQLRELRERFTSDELRKAAEGYLEAATSRYNELVERGEAALDRLRSQSTFEDASARAQASVDQAVELTQEALGTVSSRTRAVGERAAKLVGIDLPKKAPAKKAAAKKAAREEGCRQEGSGQEGRRPRRSPRSSSPTRLRVARVLPGQLGVDVLGTPPYAYYVPPLVDTVLSVLMIAVLVTTVYAFVHAAMQRPDAYTAAEKLTKPVWLIILGVAAALSFIGVFGMAIAACAAGVYLVDVRPKLLDIQGKSR